MQLINPWQSHSILLYLGQYLNALVPLMAYSGLWLLTRNRRVALFSAFLIALPFFFPGYYATWGRFTQLTGMLLMPLLLALTWNLIRGARGHRVSFWQDSRVWLIAILAGGLLLIHVRVFLLYIPFVGVVWLLNGGRQGRRLALAGFGAILLILPQFIRLLSFVRPEIVFAPIQGPANIFPTSYLNIGWETQILYVAAGLFTLALLATRDKQRWLYLPVTLLAWVALLFLSLAGENIGLPQSWLINLNSMYITLFLPLAWLIALSLQAISGWLRQGHWIVQTIAYIAVGIMLVQTATFGWQQQVTLLNDTTMLAQLPDEAGLDWLDENLPAAAIVAHGSWDWLGGVWAGSDGGAWLLPATGRFSTTPPVDHTYDSTLWVEVQEFNRAAMAIQDWSDPAATDWLKGQDVSHIYIGARGGYLEPYQLTQNPNTELLYASDGVFIFALK